MRSQHRQSVIFACNCASLLDKMQNQLIKRFRIRCELAISMFYIKVYSNNTQKDKTSLQLILSQKICNQYFTKIKATYIILISFFFKLQILCKKQNKLKQKISKSNTNQVLNQNQMSMSQSKLMLQLSKQQKISEKVPFNEEKIEDLYSTTSKLQPKNLMLVEFLTLVIEKNLCKNSFKLQTFIDMYEEIRGKKLEQDHNSLTKKSNTATTYSNNSNSNNFGQNSQTNMSASNLQSNTQSMQKQQQKFNKKKFLKLLKDVAKLLYPGDPRAYQVTLYLRLVMPQQQQNRMKVDDNLKKYLNEQVFSSLSSYNKQLQTLFEVYMPQNYNHKLNFQWTEIRLLEKKLPMMCLLRILNEAGICSNLMSQIQLLEILTKMIPPMNSNHKEIMFYYSETFNSYMREHITSQEIKLLDGDIGLTFLEFQMVMVRVATQLAKENKQEYLKYFDKLMAMLNIGDIIKTKKQLASMTKLQTSVLTYLKDVQKSTPYASRNKPSLKKESLLKKERQELEKLLDQNDSQPNMKNRKSPHDKPLKKLQHESMLITRDDLSKIKRNLDDQLGPIPQKMPIDKQNQGYFNVNEKFVVIGDQLPKLQQKNKPVAKPNPKQKKQDPFFGFKLQQQPKAQSKKALLLNRKRKLRLNTEYPIILSQVFYPTSFSDSQILEFKEQQQVYLQTTYIHLGQRMYEEAYINFQKAKMLSKQKKFYNPNVTITQNDKKKALMAELYFEILQAQIFEAAGKDQAALVHYYNARGKTQIISIEISFNFQATQLKSKAFTYMGVSSSLYHLEQYEFALRSLLRAKQIYSDSLQTQSLDNAILLNNIGSCYMMLNRNQQASKYFNVSHQILDLKVGRFDERTLVVQQNITKNKKAYMELMPSFKTMWKTYVEKNPNLGAVKAVKKTKK